MNIIKTNIEGNYNKWCEERQHNDHLEISSRHQLHPNRVLIYSYNCWSSYNLFIWAAKLTNKIADLFHSFKSFCLYEKLVICFVNHR